MGISYHDLVGRKYMDHKFQVLSNIYFGNVYLIKFIYLENRILLFALQLPDSFSGNSFKKAMKVYIIGSLWFLFC